MNAATAPWLKDDRPGCPFAPMNECAAAAVWPSLDPEPQQVGGCGPAAEAGAAATSNPGTHRAAPKAKLFTILISSLLVVWCTSSSGATGDERQKDSEPQHRSFGQQQTLRQPGCETG
jgi:hypothetical protein